MLLAADGTRTERLLEAVVEPRTTNHRMHLDIEVSDVDGRTRVSKDSVVDDSSRACASRTAPTG
jgi:hypothetical protein